MKLKLCIKQKSRPGLQKFLNKIAHQNWAKTCCKAWVYGRFKTLNKAVCIILGQNVTIGIKVIGIEGWDM